MPNARAGLSATLSERADQPARHSSIKLPNGMKIVHPVYTPETEFVYKEIFEDNQYLRNGVALKDGAVVVDVGAHVGLFSLFALTRFENVRTFSFEPVPSTHDALAKNIAVHGSKRGGTSKLFRHGISDKNGNVEFTTYPRAPGNSTMFPAEKNGHIVSMERELLEHTWDYGKGFAILLYLLYPLRKLIVKRAMKFLFRPMHVRAPVRPLSEIIDEEQIETIDLLKVDCEGAELDVLRGITPAHWPRVRQVVMELADVNGRVDATLALLNDQGFEVVTWQPPFMERLRGCFVYARRV